MDKRDVECRGFLMFLEQQGILDAIQRELVLDRAMALDQDEFDLDDLKWVVLMVLFNQPGQEAAFAWMETQMFDDERRTAALSRRSSAIPLHLCRAELAPLRLIMKSSRASSALQMNYFPEYP